MLWFRAPEKVYFKKGCLPVALAELKNVMGKKKAFIVTDAFLYQNGYTKPMDREAGRYGHHPHHLLQCSSRSHPRLRQRGRGADGGLQARSASSPSAAAPPWTRARSCGCCMSIPRRIFMDMAMRFVDIRKRVYTFPKMGEKAYFVAIPTTAGTGSEVTPFAVITDETTGVKYPLADYELLPKMAIVDADMMMNAPKGLTCGLRHRRRDPRPGSLRLHDGHRLHRRSGAAEPEADF